MLTRELLQCSNHEKQSLASEEVVEKVVVISLAVHGEDEGIVFVACFK